MGVEMGSGVLLFFQERRKNPPMSREARRRRLRVKLGTSNLVNL